MRLIDAARIGFRYMTPDGLYRYIEADRRGVVADVSWAPIPGIDYQALSRINAAYFGEFLVSAIRRGELD